MEEWFHKNEETNMAFCFLDIQCDFNAKRKERRLKGFIMFTVKILIHKNMTDWFPQFSEFQTLHVNF